LIFRFIRSRDATISIIGMSLLVLCFKSLFISGNLDIAIGKIMALLITAMIFTFFWRAVSSLGYRRSLT